MLCSASTYLTLWPQTCPSCTQQVLFVFWFLKVSKASLAAEFPTTLSFIYESGPAWAVEFMCCHLEPRSVPAFGSRDLLH